jgi:aspartate aminotransferase
VLKALLNPGDEVLTVAPFFVEYTFYAENYGGQLVVVQPRADLTPDLARIEAAITPRTRAIILNSPNNPSGVIYPESTFVELELLLGRIDQPIVVISDEPYRALVFDDVTVPEVPPLVTRAVVATSWSKSLAIPGERIGYLAFLPAHAGSRRAVRGVHVHQPGPRLRERPGALAVGGGRGGRSGH